jgi:hypothetical protein
MGGSAKPGSYEWECLSVLAYETASDDPKEAERKIKSRLRRKKLGAYDQARIDRLRELKNRVQQEFFTGWQGSKYYVGGKEGSAEVADFNIPVLLQDLRTAFPEIPADDVERITSLGVFLYYLR